MAGWLHAPLVGLHVPAEWHWSKASQATGLAPVQLPAWQVSLCVQALPSLHAAPSALAGWLHAPLVGLHVPAAWHWSLAPHVTGLAPMHAPAWHVSLWVHALPSLHKAPSALAGLLHAPLAGLQVPASWHWSEAAHSIGFAPLQLPP